MANEIQQTSIGIVGGVIQASTVEEAYRYSQYILRSGLAPKAFDTPEKVLIACQMGAELGLKPMQALQSIAVINGRPSVWGKAMAGIVLNSGVCEIFEESFEGEGENLVAVCKVKRKGVETIRIERYSVSDARKAGLWGKSGTWTQYPKDMLRYKARARAFILFADILSGLPIAEDIVDVQEERESLKNVISLPKGQEIVPAQDPLLDGIAVAEVIEEPDTKEEPAPVPAKDGKQKVNKDQIQHLVAYAKQKGVTTDDMKLLLQSRYHVSSSKDLTVDMLYDLLGDDSHPSTIDIIGGGLNELPISMIEVFPTTIKLKGQ